MAGACSPAAGHHACPGGGPISLKRRLLAGLSVLGWLCASPAFAGSAAEKVYLRKKIVRSGGNARLLTFDSDDLKRVYAEVHRCEVVPK